MNESADSEPEYADVAFDMPGDGVFQYAVPPALDAQLPPGALVLAPVRHSRRIGAIIERTAHKKAERLKPVLRRVMPEFQIPPELLRLGEFISEYYLCSRGAVLAALSFLGFNEVRRKVRRAYQLSRRAEALAGLRAGVFAPALTPKQQLVLKLFAEGAAQQLTAAEVKLQTGAGESVLRELLKKHWLELIDERLIRGDDYPAGEVSEQHLIFNAAQQQAFDAIRRTIEAEQFRAFLLHGVTGSGKTEIYLQAIGLTLERGRQAIVLVPEIALTPQTVERFRRRFGMQAGVYHSGLSLGQKYDLLERINRGEVNILIGARSAVFAPFPRLGLIVIDEEHETAYKQSTAPCYHGRDVALMRAKLRGAAVVLGSATPSLESYHNAQAGKYELLSLPARHSTTPLPEVRLIDLRRELRDQENPGLFSKELAAAIEQRLAAGEQTILFLNRRGYNPVVLCRECGQYLRCENDDVLLTHHKRSKSLVCHLCGKHRPFPKACPQCGAEGLHALGLGTERIEEAVAAQFPGARCLRIDLDTTSSKFSFLEKWDLIRRGEADIILGTQMIAKGFDLPGVTLVGVVLADVSLFQPDFRAPERAFALLTQVAGRAGRRERQGEVIVQTYVPEHYAIQFARTHDYEGFYTKEIYSRRLMRFPPHFRLTSLTLSGPHADNVAQMARRLGREIDAWIQSGNSDDRALAVLGPAPAPIAYINKQFRWRLLLRGSRPAAMREALRNGLEVFHQRNPRPHVKIQIDADPLDLL